MAIRGISIAMLSAGGILVWSGLNNKKITQTIQDLVQGKQPQPGPSGGTVSNVSPGSGGTVIGAGSASGQAIAQDALQYQGRGYVWDGAPANGLGNWDCSSFVNWVVGHDMQLGIPGDAHYTGASHGPNTLVWLASIGTLTRRVPRNQLAAGDLCVW